MPNYPNKRKKVRFYLAETRDATANGEELQLTAKIYFKYPLNGIKDNSNTFNPLTECLDVKAYIRQLSDGERNAALAVQDDSTIEVAINKRPLQIGMYMEFFESGKTYKIGAPDYFEFSGTELKFRAKEVIPVTFDIVEYRSYQ